jgi:PEGA domain
VAAAAATLALGAAWWIVPKRPARAIDAAGVPQNTPLSAAQNTPLSAAQNTPSSPAQNSPLSAAQNTPLSAAQNTPLSGAQNTPQDTVHNAPLKTAQDTSLNAAHHAPLNTVQDTPLSAAQNTPLNAAQDAQPAAGTLANDRARAALDAAGMVTVSVASVPAGAEVFVGGEHRARGRTPLLFSLPSRGDKTRLVLIAPRFAALSTEISTANDTQLRVALVPLRHAAAPATASEPAPAPVAAKKPPRRPMTTAAAPGELADPFTRH